jgi:hypothetical protein
VLACTRIRATLELWKSMEVHMERQNITLSLSKLLLKQARHLAVERGQSLSALLGEFIEEMVTHEKTAARAGARMRRRLREGLHLGTGGAAKWTREDLHAR